MDWVHPGQGGGDDGMPHLVIGHDLALVRIEQSAAFLDAGYDAFDCTSEVVCADGVSAAPRCPQRGFVDQIGQVDARKARRQRRDPIEIETFGELDLFRMYAKNCCTADPVRPIDQHLAVERPARSSAGSRISGRLIAASNTMPSRGSKPSHAHHLLEVAYREFVSTC